MGMRHSGALWILAAAFVGYAVLPDVLGRRNPRALRRGASETGMVALTFDDGPHPEITPIVLDHLAAAGAHGTFFVVGENVHRYPHMVRRIVEEGHSLGVHTTTHPHAWVTTPGRIRREMTGGLESIVEATGRRPFWFRPPYGAFNAVTWNCADALRLQVALWSCDAGDWLPGASREGIRRRVVGGLSSGAIVDLHDGGQTPRGCWAMAEALPEILAVARERGLRPVHLGELFGLPAMAEPAAVSP